VAEQMQYRARVHKHDPGKMTDVFDGSHYRSLLGQRVQLNGKPLRHRFFDDHRDIALGLSTDGFSPFKKRKITFWAFILFNYNLPPDTRFHAENILALGVIGPRKPGFVSVAGHSGTPSPSRRCSSLRRLDIDNLLPSSLFDTFVW